MNATFWGLICLFWFSGALPALGLNRSCRLPPMTNGFLVPDQDVYQDKSQVFYSCDPGYKPVAEGWWQTVTCDDGKWLHKPECIDANSCLPLLLPNGKQTNADQHWFPHGFRSRVTCNPGFRSYPWNAQAHCVNGTWSDKPACEKKTYACDEPPRQHHAVVVSQGHQTVFEAGAELHYACEDGYSFEGQVRYKTISCNNGQWSPLDQCVNKNAPGPDPSTTGSVGPPSGGSSIANSNTKDDGVETSITRCGAIPIIPNGDVIKETRTYIRYQCAAFFTLEGSDVFCLTDGSWSKLPTCKANYCVVDTERNPELVNNGQIYLKHKQERWFTCSRSSYIATYYSYAKCDDGTLSMTPCCSGASHNLGRCY